MFTFTLPFLYLLLLSTATAQPYKATEHFLLDCGSSLTTTSFSRQWDGDEHSNFLLSNTPTSSFLSTPTAQYPPPSENIYTTARIFNTSSFTYRFPVSQGPKFLRLYFYPATYSDLKANQSFFSVSSNGFSLLTNFSASLTASFLYQECFLKEFIIYVQDSQFLNVTFTPSPNSYAFVNGIEVVSMPENLYFKANKFKYVCPSLGPAIDSYTALESVYRLNVGGGYLSGNDDSGMYRLWDRDDDYLSSAIGLTPTNQTPITYSSNDTAPELVYQSQRSMGKLSDYYNLTWTLPVDSGFWYMLRLHFCNIIPHYTLSGQVIFRIFINNQTAEDEADVLFWTPGSGYPVYRDYGVYVFDPDVKGSKRDLWVAVHPNREETGDYHDGYLNGLEVFKLNMTGNLSSPNPELSSTTPPERRTSPVKGSKKKTPYFVIFGGVGGGLVLLSLVLITFWWRRRAADKSSRGPTSSQSNFTKSSSSSLPSDRCRYFTLKEVKFATDDFSENCVIGHGGFGKVYKGYMDDATTTVAIKRLNESSSQGFHEFQTEIAMLSKLRHVNLVSLIGYCDDNGEMILVYEYMAHGTLREHLYKTNNPPLSWKTRLHICIGAAKGLHYLHTSGKRKIIHRDIKSTNILLDEKWVAKVSDFGLSKLGSKDPSKTYVSTMVKGSIGYMDPDYCKTKQLTDKSDVYSFGVVLFEVLCARPAILQQPSEEQVSLAWWGKTCYRRGTLHEIIDPKLSDEITPGCLRKFGEVASSCLHEEGTERPDMEDVVWGLEFALKLQENVKEVISENQELPFLMEEEPTTLVFLSP